MAFRVPGTFSGGSTRKLSWDQTKHEINLTIILEDENLDHKHKIHIKHDKLILHDQEYKLNQVVVVDDSIFTIEKNQTDTKVLFTLKKAVPQVWNKLLETDPDPDQPPVLLDPLERKEPKSRAELLQNAKQRLGSNFEPSRANTHEIEGQCGSNIVLDPAILPSLPVVTIRSCSDSNVTVPTSVCAVKLSIEGCKNCKFIIHGKVITEMLELWRCDSCELHVATPMKTIQIDGSADVLLEYTKSAFFDRLYTSGARSTKLTFTDNRSLNGSVDFDDLQHAAGSDLSPETDQFITRHVQGKLLTALIIRLSNDFPTTEREVAEFARATSMAREKVDEVVSSMVGSSLGKTLSEQEREQMRNMMLEHASQTESARKQAEQTAEGRIAARVEYKRKAGNEAFTAGNFQDAAVLYSEAIALDDKVESLYTNRAAAFLKLGRYAQAREDAEHAIVLNSKFAKAHFRLGLAHQAESNFSAACASFSECLRLEPRNKEASAGLRMSEVQAERARRMKDSL